jgi:hypothetical protein
MISAGFNSTLRSFPGDSSVRLLKGADEGVFSLIYFFVLLSALVSAKAKDCQPLGHLGFSKAGLEKLTEVVVRDSLSSMEQSLLQSRSLWNPVNLWKPGSMQTCASAPLNRALKVSVVDFIGTESVRDTKVKDLEGSLKCYPLPVFQKKFSGELALVQDQYIATSGELKETKVENLKLSFSELPSCSSASCRFKLKVDDFLLKSKVTVSALSGARIAKDLPLVVSSLSPLEVVVDVTLGSPSGGQTPTEIGEFASASRQTKVLLDPTQLEIRFGKRAAANEDHSSHQTQLCRRTFKKVANQVSNYEDLRSTIFSVVLDHHAKQNAEYRKLVKEGSAMSMQKAHQIINQLKDQIGSSPKLGELHRKTEILFQCMQGKNCALDCLQDMSLLRRFAFFRNAFDQERATEFASENQMLEENARSFLMGIDLVKAAIAQGLATKLIAKEIAQRKYLLRDQINAAIKSVPEAVENALIFPVIGDSDLAAQKQQILKNRSKLLNCVQTPFDETEKLNCFSLLKVTDKKLKKLQEKIDETYVQFKLKHSVSKTETKNQILQAHFFNYDSPECQKGKAKAVSTEPLPAEVHLRTEITLDSLNLFFEKLYKKFRYCVDQKKEDGDCQKGILVTFEKPPNVKYESTSGLYVISGSPQIDSFGGVRTEVRMKPGLCDDKLCLKEATVEAHSENPLLLIFDAGSQVESAVESLLNVSFAPMGLKLVNEPFAGSAKGHLIMDWKFTGGSFKGNEPKLGVQ